MNLIFLTLFLLGSLRQSNAVVSCYHEDLQAFGLKAKKIVEFKGVRGPAQTISEYAHTHDMTDEQTASKFAATGKLQCGASTSSANLVVKGDIILAAGHPFVDRKTCVKRRSPSQCLFTVEGKTPIKVRTLVSSGNKCPKQKGDPSSDWAILKLDSPVEGVKPYKLKTYEPNEFVKPQDVVAVGAISADFTRVDPKTGKTILPKRIQDCRIKSAYLTYDPVVVGSDCGGSNGKSGGALLDPNLAEPTIVGISTGTPVSPEEAEVERRTGKPLEREYASPSVVDQGILIWSELNDALINATK